MSGASVAHMLGDYVVQSDWMAAEKTNHNWPAAAHALSYAACFVPLTRSLKALAVIGGTHYLIDRYRLAQYIAWAKNQIAPAHHRYRFDQAAPPTGYRPKVYGQHTLLMVATDNAIHMAINEYALRRWSTA